MATPYRPGQSDTALSIQAAFHGISPEEQAAINRQEAKEPRGLYELCAAVGFGVGRILAMVADVDQTSTCTMLNAISAGLAEQAPSLRDRDDQFVAAIMDDRDEAVIDGIALPGSSIRHPDYGAGTVLGIYRRDQRMVRDGTIQDAWEWVWTYRCRFNAGLVAEVPARSVMWIGGIAQRVAA